VRANCSASTSCTSPTKESSSVVAADEAEAALAALRSHPLGADAAEVGEIIAEPEETVVVQTGFGGTRIVDMLVGDPLPRIC
jgi:hydrogenase expression/formation protein HypE